MGRIGTGGLPALSKHHFPETPFFLLILGSDASQHQNLELLFHRKEQLKITITLRIPHDPGHFPRKNARRLAPGHSLQAGL